MKPVVFVLEILTPGSSGEVLRSVTAANPLMVPQAGDVIDPTDWGNPAFEGKLLRVTLVRHQFQDVDAVTQTVSVHTELTAGVTAARTEPKQQWSSAVARIRERARGIADEGRRSVDIIEQQLPKIKVLVADKVGPLARKTIEDDVAMAKTFGMVHEFLPTTIRLMVQEEAFVDFCLRNRRLLIDCLDLDEQPADENSSAEKALPHGNAPPVGELPQQA